MQDITGLRKSCIESIKEEYTKAGWTIAVNESETEITLHWELGDLERAIQENDPHIVASLLEYENRHLREEISYLGGGGG